MLCISRQSVTKTVLEVAVAWVTSARSATRGCKVFSFESTSNFGDRCSCFFLSQQFSKQWLHFFKRKALHPLLSRRQRMQKDRSPTFSLLLSSATQNMSLSLQSACHNFKNLSNSTLLLFSQRIKCQRIHSRSWSSAHGSNRIMIFTDFE